MRAGPLLEVLGRPGSLAKSVANQPARTKAVAVPRCGRADDKAADKSVLEHEDPPPRAVYTNEYGDELLEGFKGQESQASPSPEAVSALEVTRGDAGAVERHREATRAAPRRWRRVGQTVTPAFIY